MFIEFIDQLRCTSDHEDSWLVASFKERRDRFIITGTLGCHICNRQFPIIDGIPYFGDLPQNDETNPDMERQIAQEGSDSDKAIQIAAFLNASERSTLVIAGEWGIQAPALADVMPMNIFTFNSTRRVADTESVASIESTEGIPLARQTISGVALDISTATPLIVSTAVKVLRPQGRLLAPVSSTVPPEVRLLAQDDNYWVAEKVGELVTLSR